ncbi:ArsR/SmtB family transcription factor [Jiangella endophytica]|uniref:ArsR/SmtB family transcription factor n=1 Tax=Jiangella endophytica TaxID=1623398 RepID=UPI000E353AEF|nr:metalloregulator ArsR/SmtB family transcription factor [Jiangella endophytica]
MSDALSLVFGALADPTRRGILARLAEGPAPVTELGRPFDMTAQAISKHLKVLERAGLVTRGRQGQWRPCRLEVEPLDRATGWIEQHRAVWADSLDRLEQEIVRIQEGRHHDQD